MSEPLPWQSTAGGLRIRVRATPKASRDAVEGIEATAEGPALKVRVRAVPEDGAANSAVERMLAAWLGVANSATRLVGGSKSRIKTIEIAGNGAALAETAARLAASWAVQRDKTATGHDTWLRHD
jgi:uncharacterized protein YggU (UPF0235/DUF167 family)